MVTEPLKWYENADNPPWIRALGRGSTQGDAWRLVLSPCSSDHRGDRPVCGGGLRKPGVLLKPALWCSRTKQAPWLHVQPLCEVLIVISKGW